MILPPRSYEEPNNFLSSFPEEKFILRGCGTRCIITDPYLCAYYSEDPNKPLQWSLLWVPRQKQFQIFPWHVIAFFSQVQGCLLSGEWLLRVFPYNYARPRVRFCLL